MLGLRFATNNDVDTICQLHCDAFPGFFLTSLGSAFLRQLYRSFISEKSGCCLVAVDEGNVVGFAAGTSVPDFFFPMIRKKRLFRFAWSALPGLLKNPIFVVRKCWSALSYKGEPVPNIGNAALLSSLAVSPSCAGRGIGAELVSAFGKEMKRSGATAMYLTTDAEENDQVNRFYEKCGFQLRDSFVRPGKRVMNRWVKNLESE